PGGRLERALSAFSGVFGGVCRLLGAGTPVAKEGLGRPRKRRYPWLGLAPRFPAEVAGRRVRLLRESAPRAGYSPWLPRHRGLHGMGCMMQTSRTLRSPLALAFAPLALTLGASL